MQRITSLDLARGFTVLFIPIIHSMMLYGNSSVHTSSFADILAFIAEWPGAQVFMIIMGISFALGRKKTFKEVLFRSFVLLLLGYALNLAKFVIPDSAGILPLAFLNDIGGNNWLVLFTIGDILHFAAIALIILFLLSKVPDYPPITIILAFGICFISPQVWTNSSSNIPKDHFFQLAAGGPPITYFPLFPWLVYPLAGSVIGFYLKTEGDKTFSFLLPAGVGFMIAAFCAGSPVVVNDAGFYRPGPWKTIMHLGFATAWIAMWHFVSRVCTDNLVFRFLQFLSKRITLIYLIQWPVICWLLPVFGYHKLNVWESLFVGIDTSLFVFLLCLIISRLNPHRKEIPRYTRDDNASTSSA